MKKINSILIINSRFGKLGNRILKIVLLIQVRRASLAINIFYKYFNIVLSKIISFKILFPFFPEIKKVASYKMCYSKKKYLFLD